MPRLFILAVSLVFYLTLVEANLFQTIHSLLATRDHSVRSFHVIALGHIGANETKTAVDVGVEIITDSEDSTVHVMKTDPDQSNLLYHVDIPAKDLSKDGQGEIKYRYVLLEPNTKNIKTTELFHRTLTEDSTLNEFYGRETTVYDDIPTLSNINDPALFPIGFDRTPNTLHKYNEIVTLHIRAPPEQVEQMHTNYKQDIHIKSTLTYISSDNVRIFKDCTFSIGGRSSKRFTKLPYKLKLSKKDDLGGYRKFKLRTTASDPSYLREKLAYDIHSAAGRPISQASYVRVFINDQAIGLFLLAERYDKTWLQNEFYHGEDSKDGILYKSQGSLVKEKKFSDLTSYPSDLGAYKTMFSVEEGGKKTGEADLLDLVEFIDKQLKWQEANKEANDALDDSVKLWEEKLNVQGVLTNLALEFLVGTWDNYIQNAQNYYLYKPDGGPIDWLAWDFDFSFGNGPVKMECLVTGDYHNFTGMMTRPLSKALLAIPTLKSDFESKITTLAHHLFAPEITFPWIDQWIVILKLDILWDQTLPKVRWGKSYSDMTRMTSSSESNGDNMSLPDDFSLSAGMDFISRVNANVSLSEAIEGPSDHKSLMPLKVFLQQKTQAVFDVLE